MGNKLYVGNISFKTQENGLEELFSQCGSVQSVKIIIDKVTGRSRGFGFVEMADSDEADAAVKDLDGKEVEGRNLKVNIAEDKQRDSSSSSNNRGPRDFNGNR